MNRNPQRRNDENGQMETACCGVLLIRPPSRAAETAKRLLDHGLASFSLPLSRPVLTATSLPSAVLGKGEPADLIFTSPTAVEMFAELLSKKNLKIDPEFKIAWCVGKRTAEAARTNGFEKVLIAGGNALALAGLVAEKQGQLSGSVFHMAPRDRAVDLPSALSGNGISVTTQEIYTNELIDCGREALYHALTMFKDTIVFNYSQRTTTHFVNLLAKHGLLEQLKNMSFISISEKIANIVGQHLSERNWVAKQPQERFMIEMAVQHMQSCCDS